MNETNEVDFAVEVTPKDKLAIALLSAVAGWAAGVAAEKGYKAAKTAWKLKKAAA